MSPITLSAPFARSLMISVLPLARGSQRMSLTSSPPGTISFTSGQRSLVPAQRASPLSEPHGCSSVTSCRSLSTTMITSGATSRTLRKAGGRSCGLSKSQYRQPCRRRRQKEANCRGKPAEQRLCRRRASPQKVKSGKWHQWHQWHQRCNRHFKRKGTRHHCKRR